MINEIRPYFYEINYTENEKELCELEMKYLLKEVPKDKWLFSEVYVNPSRSVFIKSCISIIYMGDSIQNIINQILKDDFSSDKFKVCFVNSGDRDIAYKDRLKEEYDIGFYINGRADVHNPKVLFGIVKVNNKWVFGKLMKNDFLWKEDNHKRFEYSNGLGVKISRTAVNIAVANESKCKLVDPCCGIGTVIIEALSMGIEIKGWEINPLIAKNAKSNLNFFGLKDVITEGDMCLIDERFDVAIVDLPYGLFSSTTLDEQIKIIKTARKISDRMIILTFENMDKYLQDSGFKVVDKCIIKKGKFGRILSVCV